MFIFNDTCVFCSCVICQTDAKLAKVNVQLSRQNIAERIQKHPRSPWWINNICAVDFCRVSGGANIDNTAILGKYLPRDHYFWERCPGMHLKKCTCLCKLVLLNNISWFWVSCDVLHCFHVFPLTKCVHDSCSYLVCLFECFLHLFSNEFMFLLRSGKMALGSVYKLLSMSKKECKIKFSPKQCGKYSDVDRNVGQGVKTWRA